MASRITQDLGHPNILAALSKRPAMLASSRIGIGSDFGALNLSNVYHRYPMPASVFLDGDDLSYIVRTWPKPAQSQSDSLRR
jgi:hypothetical protein